ncbi:PaaX family transcriptional regulator C-terminal domain-containing protein [Saccharopolyspora spinosporotrichia]|uniref:PaaX family transcriptional regulator C-terminal domain-containing protein n=1 Tax=Saccharopolyspora erythraea TaxID=1836 RepID=A0ABP3MLL0_SACER
MHRRSIVLLPSGRRGRRPTYRVVVTTDVVAEDEAFVSELTGRGAQPRQLIVTVYGLYARESGGWLSVAALVRLLGDLGVDEPAVRSSISRLKRRGILVASRQGGAAGYVLSEQALEILREGDERIFSQERATAADGWLLAVFSVPESQRQKRHVLRTQLTRLGFGTVAPGVWIAPAHLHAAATSALRRFELDSYAELFRSDHVAFGDLREKVAQWWDLEQLQELYGRFVGVHEPVLRRWQRRRSRREREAFLDYVRVLTDWRRLPYLDPGLPADLLPAEWNGAVAAELFFSLRASLQEQAHAYVDEVTGRR